MCTQKLVVVILLNEFSFICTELCFFKRDCSDFESEQDQENNVNIEEQLSSSDKRNVKYLKEWEYSEPIRTIADGQLRIILKNSQNELNVSNFKRILKRYSNL